MWIRTCKTVDGNKQTQSLLEHGKVVGKVASEKHATPPITVILCVKNERAIVVSGFLMK